METILDTPIKFVSLNQKFISCRFVLSKSYRTYKDTIKKLLKVPSNSMDLRDCDFGMDIYLHTHLDIDNCLKATIDAICERLWINDSRLTQLNVHKTKVKKTQMGYIIVNIYK